MMKHAYLILAHHEFDLLQLLVSAIDDPRNDIYIHFDKKTMKHPSLEVQHAQLSVLTERIDVRWGDVSQMWAEYSLWRASYDPEKYSYYHLISGVDLPLKSQDYIHEFFRQHQGKEFIGFNSEEGVEALIDRKVQRTHLFPQDFRGSGLLSLGKKVIRFAYLRLQYLLNIRRNTSIEFRKGTNWVSITSDFVKLLLDHEAENQKIYSQTFCCDEIYKQTQIWNSPLRDRIFNLENEGIGCQRAIGWRDGVLYDFCKEDEEFLKQTPLLFARKFNSRDMDFLKRITSYDDVR